LLSSTAFITALFLPHFLLITLQWPRLPETILLTTNYAARSTSGQSASYNANSEPTSQPCASLPAVSTPWIQHSPAIKNASIVELVPNAIAAI